MKETLNLKLVTAYALEAGVDDRSEIKGYYKDENIAVIDSKGAGSWNEDGKVNEVKVYTDGENIYQVTLLKGDNFVDSDSSYRESAIARVKAKLSKSDLALLGIKE